MIEVRIIDSTKNFIITVTKIIIFKKNNQSSRHHHIITTTTNNYYYLIKKKKPKKTQKIMIAFFCLFNLHVRRLLNLKRFNYPIFNNKVVAPSVLKLLRESGGVCV